MDQIDGIFKHRRRWGRSKWELSCSLDTDPLNFCVGWSNSWSWMIFWFWGLEFLHSELWAGIVCWCWCRKGSLLGWNLRILTWNLNDIIGKFMLGWIKAVQAASWALPVLSCGSAAAWSDKWGPRLAGLQCSFGLGYSSASLLWRNCPSQADEGWIEQTR